MHMSCEVLVVDLSTGTVVNTTPRWHIRRNGRRRNRQRRDLHYAPQNYSCGAICRKGHDDTNSYAANLEPFH
jgi:hypothetical protein